MMPMQKLKLNQNPQETPNPEAKLNPQSKPNPEVTLNPPSTRCL